MNDTGRMPFSAIIQWFITTSLDTSLIWSYDSQWHCSIHDGVVHAWLILKGNLVLRGYDSCLHFRDVLGILYVFIVVGFMISPVSIYYASVFHLAYLLRLLTPIQAIPWKLHKSFWILPPAKFLFVTWRNRPLTSTSFCGHGSILIHSREYTYSQSSYVSYRILLPAQPYSDQSGSKLFPMSTL